MFPYIYSIGVVAHNKVRMSADVGVVGQDNGSIECDKHDLPAQASTALC